MVSNPKLRLNYNQSVLTVHDWRQFQTALEGLIEASTMLVHMWYALILAS